MRVRLDKVRGKPFQWSEATTVDPASLGNEDLVGLGPVSWEGEIAFTDPDFLLRARYSYDQTVACTRCLEPVTEPVSGDVQLLLTQEGADEPGVETELTDRDLDVVSVRGDEIDLDPVLREQIQLNVPMKPVCRPDCSGLCPQCGVRRSEGSCDCEIDTTDPRWDALKALKKT